MKEEISQIDCVQGDFYVINGVSTKTFCGERSSDEIRAESFWWTMKIMTPYFIGLVITLVWWIIAMRKIREGLQ